MDAMKRTHETPVRNQESGIQGSQDVVSAGNSHPRRAGMKPICWRSIARPIGVMEAMKDWLDSRSLNSISSLLSAMRMNVGNWNVQHRTMKRVRRMSIVVTVWRLDTENREIVPITPGASLAVIRDMNAEYVLVAAQVRGGAEWLTVSSVPRMKGTKRVTGAKVMTLKVSRLVIVSEACLEKCDFSFLILKDEIFGLGGSAGLFSGSRKTIPNGTPRYGKTNRTSVRKVMSGWIGTSPSQGLRHSGRHLSRG